LFLYVWLFCVWQSRPLMFFMHGDRRSILSVSIQLIPVTEHVKIGRRTLLQMLGIIRMCPRIVQQPLPSQLTRLHIASRTASHLLQQEYVHFCPE
jgi:hypothetical protein